MHCSQDDSDVIIDWGDGNVEVIKERQFTGAITDKYEYVGSKYDYYEMCITHKYSSEFLDKKLIVTIYGSRYFMIRGDYRGLVGGNIISRALCSGFPMAKNVINISSLFAGSLRLQRILIPYESIPNATNISVLCNGCKNLLFVSIDNSWKTVYSEHMFMNCENLEYSDFKLKNNDSRQVYYNCKNLNVDINTLIPNEGFPGSTVRLTGCFTNCEKLYGKLPESLLWKSSNEFITMANNIVYDLPDLPARPGRVWLTLPEFTDTLPELTEETIELVDSIPSV